MATQSVKNFSPKSYYTDKTNVPHHRERKHISKEKLGTAATSALGVATAVALISKRQGFSLNLSKIAKTPLKDLAIFKITDKARPNEKILTLKTGEILTIGGSSVLGGLAGGAIFDKKENFPSKCAEAVSQFIGDISLPLGFVAIPTMLYKNFESLAEKETKHLKLKSASKFIQGNKFFKVLCPTIVSGTSLGAGIIAGNKVSNKINEKVYGEKQNRGIRVTDFAPHLDDVCLAITLMAEKSPLGDIISKFVPIALTIAGIETGTAKPHNKN